MFQYQFVNACIMIINPNLVLSDSSIVTFCAVRRYKEIDQMSNHVKMNIGVSFRINTITVM